MKVNAGALNVWVFGPGVGEFIVVHVPPLGWLAIDGCSADADKWPLRFFEQQQVTPSHILFTHPHADHARGLQKLVERFTPAGATWPRLGLVSPPQKASTRGRSQSTYDSKLANGVLSAMKTRWKRQPTSRWEPRGGQREAFGDGELRVLSPSIAALRKPRGNAFDWNTVATALAVDWKGHRVVLGADLVEKPGQGWTAALKGFPDARKHLVLKVAHHGSLKAQHAPLLARLAGEADVTLVATPFASEDLPRFATNEGAHLLLKHSKSLHLTGLPQSFETQNKSPRQWPRHRLAKLKKPIRPSETVGPFPFCYVHLSITAAGKVTVDHGPGSVIVHRS